MADALAWSPDTVVCVDTSGAPEVNTLSQDNTLLTKKDSLLMSIMTKTRHSLSELLKHRAAPYVMAATLALTPACTGVGENKDAVKAPSWTEPVSLLQSATAEVDKTCAPETDNEKAKEILVHGYSQSECNQMMELIKRSRDFTQEYKLDTELSDIRFSPKDNSPFERLSAVNSNLAKLTTLPSKTIKEATGVDQITPENMRDVLTFVHTADEEEKVAIYGTDETVKSGAWSRVIADQGKRWREANLPNLSDEALQRACDLANTLLAHQTHISREWARYVVTSALDLIYTPKAPDPSQQEDVAKQSVKNRWLNLTNDLSWMTTMASKDVPWWVAPEEIVKITVGPSTYSFAPMDRIAKIPGLPDDKKQVTSIAYGMLQDAQTKYLTVVQSERDNARLEAHMAQTDLEIAQIRAHTNQTEAHTNQTEQHEDIINTVESIRGKFLPLFKAYIWAPEEKRENIRKEIKDLAKQLIQAEVYIQGVWSLNEENARQKAESLGTIQRMYGDMHDMRINIDELKKELKLS